MKDEEYKKAKRFRDQFVYISKKYLNNKSLIILLYSIDQMFKNDYDVKWLFTDLHKGVKILN